MTPKRSRLAFALSLLLAPAVASAQTPPPPDEPGAGMPMPPPEEEEPAPVVAIMPPVPVEPAPAPAPPPPPEKLTVAKEGYFQPAILFQSWLVADNGPSAADPTIAASTDFFRIRRAELHAKGQIIPSQVSYEINVDFAKVLEPKNTTIGTVPPVTIKEPQSRISAMQDLYLTYLSKNAEVSMGQFKIPVSWEGYNSSGKILFPERALSSRTFGDLRDIGIRVTKTFEKFMYSAGVFNGTGPNAPDTNNGKDVALRVEVYPVKGLMLGAVTYDSVFNRKEPGAKDRWELDARYEKDEILVQAEAILARDYGATSTLATGQGFYAAFAYKLPNKVQPMIRISEFDPNNDVDTDRQISVDVGANYLLREHNAKLQASFGRTQFQGDKAADNQLIIGAQLYY